jgi:hypothetical protein
MRTAHLGHEAENLALRRTAVLFAAFVLLAVINVGVEEYRVGRLIVGSLLYWLRFTYAVYCAFWLILLFTYGRRLSARLLRSMVVFLIVPQFITSWIVYRVYTRNHFHYAPFWGYKISFMLLSLAPGPGVLVNGTMIVALTLEALVLWFFAGVRESQIGNMTNEPWSTLLAAVAAILILSFQNAYRRMSKQLGELTVRQHVLESLIGLSIIIRDKVNTPLQALKLCFERLARDRTTEVGRKSLHKIEEIVRPLHEFDSLIDWGQREFPSQEAVITQLRQDLQKNEVRFELRSTH